MRQMTAGSLGEDPHDVGAPLDLFVEPLERVRPNLAPECSRERLERQDVGAGVALCVII